VDDWPPPQAQGAVPRGIEITMVMEDGGEITRLFSLAPGL